MTSRSIIVLDDFYDDPWELRKEALQQHFSKKKRATYPGLEAHIPGRDWRSELKRLKAEIDEDVDHPCPKNPPFIQGKFRIAWSEHERDRIDKVHIDQQRWSGIVYLSRNEDCQEGLVLYKHKPTGMVTWPEKWFRENRAEILLMNKMEQREALLEFFRSSEQFEQIGIIPMRFNRAILLMAKVFHGTGRCFGSKPEEGRLTQHFEFYGD